MPSEFVVERRQHVDAPPPAVLEQIVDFHAWRQWSPWEEIDPGLRRDYGGAERGVGATYAWSGNRKAGAGRMEITAVTDRQVDIDLQFLKPFKSRNHTMFRVEPDGDGSVVTWTMTGPHSIVSRVMGIFTSMDKMIGPDFEKGLARLKAAAESD